MPQAVDMRLRRTDPLGKGRFCQVFLGQEIIKLHAHNMPVTHIRVKHIHACQGVEKAKPLF